MPQQLRIPVIASLTLVTAIVVWLLITAADHYTINARFINAGGVVPGGRVEIAGRKVGSVTELRLAPNGEAELELSIDDDSIVPLHRGTRASIRAVGQAAVTSNFVVLAPGPDEEPPLASRSILPSEQTYGTVNIDAVLNSFGAAERSRLADLISHSAQIYAGSGARHFNRMLARLDPALQEMGGLTRTLALDRAAIHEVVTKAGKAATALASRRTDLASAVPNLAQSFGAIADERIALSDLLGRVAPVLRQARGTVTNTGEVVAKLEPALRRVPAAAGPLRDYLQSVDQTLPDAGPVAGDLRSQLPDLNRSLRGLKSLDEPVVDALTSLGPAMKGLFPISEGLRYYSADLVLGVLSGLFGVATSGYDHNGHILKANFVQSPQTIVAGPLSELLSAKPLLPGVIGVRTGLERRCPGGNQPPAPDGSSPWNVGRRLCSPEDNIPASVNSP